MTRIIGARRLSSLVAHNYLGVCSTRPRAIAPVIRPHPAGKGTSFQSRQNICFSSKRDSEPSKDALQALGVKDDELINSFTQDDSEDKCRLMSVSFRLPGAVADAFAETLLSEGAVSCSLEDANVGTDDEQEIFRAGDLVGERAFYYREPEDDTWTPSSGKWKDSRLVALFPQGADVEACVNSARSILGISEPIPLKVQGTVDTDWVQKVKDAFVPAEVAPGVWVVPAWLDPVDPAAVNIRLEPGLAFGTGNDVPPYASSGMALYFLPWYAQLGEIIL
ncbi:hypothetical protein CYMTET_27104 [Cymbomonas tetramitiformis]|uniref:Uncharacterized protein n=1 Tax=Cymbomonas tetramitiformis TaxID=36881 RepID=A0AAE0FQX7_9CHLO|nr:hypothetical protein CYMTET_27104 [Cymbomonas tetramitiformis]